MVIGIFKQVHTFLKFMNAFKNTNNHLKTLLSHPVLKLDPGLVRNRVDVKKKLPTWNNVFVFMNARALFVCVNERLHP